MKKELLSILLLLVLIFSFSVYAQDSQQSAGPIPVGTNIISETSPVFTNADLSTWGFGTNSTGLTSSTLFKFFTLGGIQFIGSPAPYFWCGAIYAGNPASLYVIQQLQPYTLHILDTSTGAVTNLGTITGILPGHSSAGITGFTYDFTSQTAFITSSSLSQSQLYTLNLTTRAAVPIGSPVTNAPGVIAIAAARNGTIFAIDLSNDNLFKFNKANGTATMVGPLGYNANYGQSAEFDFVTGILYWAAIGQTQPSQLRTIDTSTGASTLIGVFTGTTQVTSLVFPYIPGPIINHNPLPNSENMNGPYVVNCVITPSGSPINPALTKLFWSRNNINITDSLIMINTSGNNWTGNIPGNGTPSTYRYYIKTTDMQNRTTTHPFGAPNNLHMFTAGPDNLKPVIIHTPVGHTPKSAWPATVTASITDNIGIDSGWVRWFKNNTSTGIRHFKLINTGGSTFSAAFNSTQAEVNYYDSIFYRIIAQDNSAAHNKDSTALYSFKIQAVANPCIGTGTTGVAWPYNTFWHDSKTNMLYTASEISAAGGGSGIITKIGFNVLTAAAQTMNGFSIKMQNTTMTSITSFTTTGWTNVYTGTYTVPGTGWQFVTLQNPFSYNGTNNLLIEICFDNTSYTTATNVTSSTTTNMCREQHTDNAAGCGFTGGINVNRPNLCMEILLPVGNHIIQSEVPNVYTLEQNYPNPFNPVTKINFAIPPYQGGKGDGYVMLVVYDIIGREVSTLVNEKMKPGKYEVTFDGTNLSSGIYFYKLETESFMDVKKMVLIK